MRVASRSLVVCVLESLVDMSWVRMPAYAEELASVGSSSLGGTSLALPVAEALAGSQRAAKGEARRTREDILR
jgi:hypothetical protein